MNRATSSVVRRANSDAASEARNSRSVTCSLRRTGSPACQSLVATVPVDTMDTVASMVDR